MGFIYKLIIFTSIITVIIISEGQLLAQEAQPSDNALETAKSSKNVTTLQTITTTTGPLSDDFARTQISDGAKIGILDDRNIMDVPVSIIGYTSQAVEDRQIRTIADVVKTDPSVRTLSSSGGMLDAYSIRGFRLNIGNAGEVAFNGLYGVAPTYRVLSDYAERIDILKGPSAFLNGIAPNGGVGGVINVIPKRAEETDINRLTANYGRGMRGGVKADISRRFGENKEFGIRVNGAYHDGDTYLDNQTWMSALGAVAFDYKGERFRATLDFLYQDEDINAPARELLIARDIKVPSASNGRRNVTQKWEWSEVTDYGAMLRAEYDINDDWMAFASLGGGQTKVDRLFGYPKIINEKGDTEDALSFMKFETKRWAFDTGLRGELDTGNLRHKVALQANYYEDTFKRGAVFSKNKILSNIYDPIAQPEFAVNEPSATPKLSQSRLSGLAISDTLSILDERVQLTVGARYQRIQSDNFSAKTGAKTSSYNEGAITPMVGLLIKPLDQISLYANYMEGLSKGDIAPNNAQNAGEILKPYVARQYEAGVKLDFGKIGATLSAFQITKPYGLLVDNFYTNDGEQRNRGIEFNLFGNITDDIRLYGGVTFLDAELTQASQALTGKTPVGTPEFLANTALEWDTTFLPGLTLSAAVNYTDKQFVDAANQQKIPAWATLDLGVRYKTLVGETPVTFRATIENVTDEAYWSSVNKWGMMAQGKPRTAYLSVTADF